MSLQFQNVIIFFVQNASLVGFPCPVCRALLDEYNVSPLQGQLLQIFETLSVSCVHDNCHQSLCIKDIDEHENTCIMKSSKLLFDVTTRPKVFKLPLYSVSAKHTRHKRLKPIISQVNEFCSTADENKTDALFFMLKDHLRDVNDPRWKLENLWMNENCNSSLSPEQCLAIRVDLLQSKGQYRAQYDFLLQNNACVFQAPSKLDICEKSFMPPASEGNVLVNNVPNSCTYY